MATFYTIRATDVGKRTILAFGQRWPVEDFIGRILKRDVGKRVYSFGDYLQVENDEQLRRRLGPTKNPTRKSTRKALPKRKANGQFAKARKAKPRKRAR